MTPSTTCLQIAPSATIYVEWPLNYLSADCPVCYNLVQDRVEIHRRKLNELRVLIRQINENPRVADDSDFRHKLDAAAVEVDDLLDDARRTGGKCNNNKKKKRSSFTFHGRPYKLYNLSS